VLFNSIAFLLFLPITFGAYWLAARNVKAQNALVVLASYVFYGWWDWRFLALIWVSSATDYLVGLALDSSETRRGRRGLLALSLAANLGILGFFKYFDFFAVSLVDLLASMGFGVSWTTLNVVLPVGISFYTFQTLSYTIDVYRKRLPATRDPVAFFAYVCFFPQLVAGPIERAQHLLPQFQGPRVLVEEDAVDGLRQILWGLFKKVVVADTCGIFVDEIFAGPGGYAPISLVAGAFFFAMQIYGDFSGYSDIAIGVARLFGIELMRNFSYPYFSRDIAEFWRRWHISLSTWFRDYLYVPLGGSRAGRWRAIRNIWLVFLVSGLWHGANWTFLAWGALNALYFLPLFLQGSNRRYLDVTSPGAILPTPEDALRIGATFGLTLVAWVFFRAESIGDAVSYLGLIVSGNPGGQVRFATNAFVLSGVMLAWEWVQREREHGLSVEWLGPAIRRPLYLGLIWLVIELGTRPRDFIYFQF
jgi:D-alanyl-lipoteichoic acid acyltransferase DltB (MBOAT superfamily)